MESSNPTLNNSIFTKARANLGSGQTMTVQGTVNKTFVLFGVLLLTAAWSWGAALQRRRGVPKIHGAGGRIGAPAL